MDEFTGLTEAITQQYPVLGQHRFVLQRGTGSHSLEFFPAWGRDNPNPGEHTIEVREPSLKGQRLQEAVTGDMLHLLGAVDPRSGVAIDPTFLRLKRQFAATITPDQKALDLAAYRRDHEGRSFEDFMDRSRLDAYLRGYIVNQWPREFYTSQQRSLLETIRQYLQGPPETAAR